MKVKLIDSYERLFLRKRSIIEMINDQNKERFPDRANQTTFKKKIFCEFIYGYCRIHASTKKPKLKIETALTGEQLMPI